MKNVIVPIIAVLLLVVSSCNKSDNAVDHNNGGHQNDSCGFGILTVVNNSWNIYRVEVDSVLYFSVNLKSSNGGSIPLRNHNIRVGVPQNYVIDTMLFIKDCTAYTLYCQ